jgi:hypothetical protein
MEVVAPLHAAAVDALCDLERDGFRVSLTDDGVLCISPRSRLTPERMRLIQSCRDGLRILLRVCDNGVQVRRQAFERMLTVPPPGIVIPAMVLVPDVPYARGVCFSCGANLPAPSFGRCWRCALAMRLAMRVPIARETFDAYLDARVLG